VEGNGQVIKELLVFLTGKNTTDFNLQNNPKVDERTIIFDMWARVLKTLSGSGCLLNTIKPEFLMPFNH